MVNDLSILSDLSLAGSEALLDIADWRGARSYPLRRDEVGS
jgi:hypothetical protein